MALVVKATRGLIAVLLLALLSGTGMPRLSAEPDGQGRQLYARICSKCHGLIQEDKLGWRQRDLLVPAVTLPLGPTLTGIYLRPAGIIEGYSYSPAFKEVATGWVWDEDALDGWLTDTQAFIRGSTMWLKVKATDRAEIIAYLKKYARYRAE